ncbi:hypothetical protein AAC387_Pa04g1545 [Persea americana]
MDRSWMLQYHNRFSQPYIDGVNSFIEFAKSTSGSALGEGFHRVRGKTRGLKVEKLRRQLGHAIPISIPASSLGPEGEFATSFANRLGEVIRDEAPVRKEGWKFVPEGIKKLVIKRVQQFFEFGDYVNDPIIKAAVDVKCQKLYRDWKCELHTHYLSLLEEGVPDPKSHPLKPCKADDWAWMIDNLWETMEWKEKSKKARVSRSKMPWNHTSGSRSFLARSSMIAKGSQCGIAVIKNTNLWTWVSCAAGAVAEAAASIFLDLSLKLSF